ncbi:fibronectin type III domain-containing protein [uncultured Fibrobacter sp.]|uniref:fibronectin type III domain-containing protein n=1 Tax=uncultured Fibrobacter sp. TaxID=261512 RepID=UPI0025FD6830|nr:fibronectin type III domain-containing protein [uncultured Fibrobacter sp.]
MGYFKSMLVLGLAAHAFAGSPIVKVDFDMSGRNSSEVTEPNYVPWVVSGVTSKDTTLSGVKIKVAGSGNLKANWYKAGVQSPSYAKLVCDGVMVEGGGNITLTFSNLAAGTHSLLLYLNNVDGVAASNSIDVYVNNLKQASVKPTNRALSTSESAIAYVTFSVSGTSASTAIKLNTSTITLNGFELNVPNAAAQATSPSPTDLDYHAPHENGAMTLSWTAAKSAKKHQVYFGTDSVAVLEATSANSATTSIYKGVQSGNSYKVSGTTPLQTYYWRVDEVDANGTVTAGNVWSFKPGRLAFDGAEGYGRNAVGGRGGKVVYVTNLNDDGAGSLREACTADIGPRTIMFKVAGVIQLKSRLVCNQDYVTIAGQTAPGKGITIKSAPIGFTGKDMVIRFMRVRLGYGATYDGMGLTGGDHSILDHASISWTIDEAFSSRGGKNLTLQRTLISEALDVADHQNYAAGTGHGYAATIGGDIGSFHHNLLAHNAGRNWSLGGGLDGNGYYAGRLDIFNNVVYNWKSRVTDGGAHEVNFVGNYYKEGAGTTLHGYTLRAQFEGTGKGSQAYYYHNNILQAANGSFTCNGNNDNCGREYTLSGGQVLDWEPWNSKPFFASYATVQSASAAYKDVLSDVGQTKPILDNHDQRMIKETKNGTYSVVGSVGKTKGIPDRETDAVDTANIKGWEPYPSTSWANDYDSDLDGLPDWWENMYGYNPKSKSGDFSDANKDRLGDGWTELERYLEWMARAHYTFAKGETQVIDLAQFTKGYDNGSYTVNAPTGVTATVNGSKLTIKLANNFGGVGYIKFTLKDNAGDTFSRDIGVTQQLAISTIVAGDSTEVGDSTTTAIMNRRAANHNDLRLFPRKQGFHDLKGRRYSKQVPYRVLF